MSFLQAIAYFLKEACVNLVRSWKISLVAITTIGVSLFLGGVFLLLAGNLRQLVEGWRGESALVLYLEAGAEAADAHRLQEKLEGAPWTLAVEPVSAEDAQQRFRQAFPSLSDLLEGWGDDPLPASLEVRVDRQRIADPSALEAWIDELRQDASVSMIDDDRDWLNQLETVVFALEVLGLVLGVILIVTAVFTISSVIRLTAYLYRDEIAVMRMVGATEFFIRGPFYMEGLLQGLAGGVLAIGTLAGVHALAIERLSSSALALVAARFLSPVELLVLIGLGGLAGLIGAVTSLRRETLGQTAETPAWAES